MIAGGEGADAAARWARVERVLSAALEREGRERKAFVDEACGGDAGLRAEVEELLAAHAESGFFDGMLAEELTGTGSSSSGKGGAAGGMTPYPPGTRIGPYEVQGVLGRGGMGVVYRARRADGEFEQEVALKSLPSGTISGRMEARFRAERQILARLSHPNVARILDGGVDDAGRPWFAMERISGTPLLEYCDRWKLELVERLDLFLAVCAGVQHAHQALVVHRDLKPGNILVDASGVPKLLDFGIAKLLDPDAEGPGALETQVGVRIFTPAYAAPEQLRGEPANTASDIYQLGILLYELLTGVHPLPERTGPPRSPGSPTATGEPTPPSGATTSREAAEARGVSPQRLRQRLRGDLDAIVLKALRDRPEHRYSTAVELTEDLHRYLARRPVRARPDGWVYRGRKFVRRNAVALGVAAAAVAGIAAFTAGIAREAQRTALQRDRAQAVSEFMQGLFAGASPYAAAGEDLRARDLLDVGVARAREQLADQLLIQASLLNVIADAYWELGLTQEGLALRREALGRWREQAAVSDEYRPDLVKSMARTGRYMALEGDMEASRTLLEEAERLLAQLPPVVEWQGAGVLNDLGLSWQTTGDPGRAEPLLEQAAVAFRGTTGQELDAAASMGNLAWLRIERGDTDSAEVFFTEALRMRRDALGPDHLLVANTLEGMGNLYVRTDRPALADSAYRESLRIRRVGLPEDHYLVHSSTMGLARAVGRMGDPVEADSLFRSAVSGLVRSLGEASAGTANARNEYALFLRSQGRMAEAAAEFERAWAGYRAVYGNDHLSSSLVGGNRAWVLHLAGRSDDAVAVFEEVLPAILQTDGRGGRFRRSQVEYGIVLCDIGRLADGLAALREAVEVMEETRPADDGELLRGKNALGQCLGSARRLEEAEAVLLEVFEATDARADDDPYRRFARQTLMGIYEAQGKDAEARRLRGGG